MFFLKQNSNLCVYKYSESCQQSRSKSAFKFKEIGVIVYTCFPSRHRCHQNPLRKVIPWSNKMALMVFGSSYQELHNTILQHLKTGIYTLFCTDILWDRTIYLVTHWWKLLFRNWFVEVSIALVLMPSSFVNSISFQNLIRGLKLRFFFVKNFSQKNSRFYSGFSSKNWNIISFSIR